MKIAVWVALGMDVLSTLTFGRSDAQVLISGAFYVVFVFVSYSLTTFTQLGPPDEWVAELYSQNLHNLKYKVCRSSSGETNDQYNFD